MIRYRLKAPPGQKARPVMPRILGRRRLVYFGYATATFGCYHSTVMQMEAVDVAEAGSAPVFCPPMRHDLRHLIDLNSVPVGCAEHDFAEAEPEE
jgi:hypothetical protein